MNSMHRQRGMTTTSWLLLIVGAGFIALMAIRVVPLYMEWFSVRSVVQAMTLEHGEHVRDRNAIVQTVLKRFNVNDITNARRENITVQPTGGGSYDLVVDYEARVNLIGNLDGVAKFRHQVVVKP